MHQMIPRSQMKDPPRAENRVRVRVTVVEGCSLSFSHWKPDGREGTTLKSGTHEILLYKSQIEALNRKLECDPAAVKRAKDLDRIERLRYVYATSDARDNGYGKEVTKWAGEQLDERLWTPSMRSAGNRYPGGWSAIYRRMDPEQRGPGNVEKIEIIEDDLPPPLTHEQAVAEAQGAANAKALRELVAALPQATAEALRDVLAAPAPTTDRKTRSPQGG